jgi:hypothetical protein
MRTTDLIARLSSEPQPTKLTGATGTILIAVLLSLLTVALMTFGWLGFRSNLGNVFSTDGHDFLLNLVFVGSIASSALAIVRDLAVPGRSLKLPSLAIVGPFILMAAVAANELRNGSLHQSFPHADHPSWLTCVWQTSMLAVPAFAILAFGIRRLAPTNLRRAGFYIGLLAGAIGSMGYCFHTPNETVTFGVTVYTIGILSMAILGALVGPRLLRWR